MPRALRIVFICILAIALPLKALAAVGVVGCAVGHGAAHDGVNHAAHHAVDQAVDHASHASHLSHLSHTSHLSHDAAGHNQAISDQAPPDGESSGGPCSSCSPCCAPAAPGTIPWAVSGVKPSQSRPVAAAHVVLRVLPDQPFKPPRFHLA